MNYRELEKTFESDGFQFQMLARQGDVALFAKHKPRLSLGFEVVIIRKRAAATRFGKDYPARELMPNNEQWGIYGWTPADWKAAWEKFELKVAQADASAMPRWVYHHANWYDGHLDKEELQEKVDGTK